MRWVEYTNCYACEFRPRESVHDDTAFEVELKDDVWAEFGENPSKRGSRDFKLVSIFISKENLQNFNLKCEYWQFESEAEDLDDEDAKYYIQLLPEWIQVRRVFTVKEENQGQKVLEPEYIIDLVQEHGVYVLVSYINAEKITLKEALDRCGLPPKGITKIRSKGCKVDFLRKLKAKQ